MVYESASIYVQTQTLCVCLRLRVCTRTYCLPVSIEALLKANHHSLHPVPVCVFCLTVHLCIPIGVLVEEHGAFTGNPHSQRKAFLFTSKEQIKASVEMVWRRPSCMKTI